jgi:hypothetical protein
VRSCAPSTAARCWAPSAVTRSWAASSEARSWLQGGGVLRPSGQGASFLLPVSPQQSPVCRRSTDLLPLLSGGHNGASLGLHLVTSLQLVNFLPVVVALVRPEVRQDGGSGRRYGQSHGPPPAPLPTPVGRTISI